MFRRRQPIPSESSPAAEPPKQDAEDLANWHERIRNLASRNNDLIRIAREICSMGGDVYKTQAERKAGLIKMRRVVVLSEMDPIAKLSSMPWGEDMARYESERIYKPRLIATLGYRAIPLEGTRGARKEFLTLWPGLTTIYGLGGVPLEDLTGANPAPIPPSYTGQGVANSYYTVTHTGGVSEEIMEKAQRARTESASYRASLADEIATHVEGLESWFELIQKDASDSELNRHLHHAPRDLYGLGDMSSVDGFTVSTWRDNY